MSNLVTPQQVADVLGISVSAADIAKAQAVIESVTGLDLSPVNVLDSFKHADANRLSKAVIWQVGYMDTNPGVTSSAGNLASASANGVSVAYAGGSSASGFICPLSVKCLDRLSWRRPRKTVNVGLSRELYESPLFPDDENEEWTPL